MGKPLGARLPRLSINLPSVVVIARWPCRRCCCWPLQIVSQKQLVGLARRLSRRSIPVVQANLGRHVRYWMPRLPMSHMARSDRGIAAVLKCRPSLVAAPCFVAFFNDEFISLDEFVLRSMLPELLAF